MKKLLLFAILLPVIAAAGSLKITEKVDDFTNERYLEAGRILVCTTARAAPCASVYLIWRDSDPFNALMMIEVGGSFTSMTEVLFNIDGQISRYRSGSFTDIEYDTGMPGQVFQKSRTGFFVPVIMLAEVATSKDNGVVRIAGINNAVDYDFYKKASFFNTPYELLQDFVIRVAIEHQAISDLKVVERIKQEQDQ